MGLAVIRVNERGSGMTEGRSRSRFRHVAAGVILDEEEAHICVLGEEGWPHYTSVAIDEPAQWRRALATLADPTLSTLGKHRRPNVRKPFWLGLELLPGVEPPSRLLAIVLMPKGHLSILEPRVVDDYAARVQCSVDCRFDRAELLANYVLRNHPETQDELLVEAANGIRLVSLRNR